MVYVRFATESGNGRLVCLPCKDIEVEIKAEMLRGATEMAVDVRRYLLGHPEYFRRAVAAIRALADMPQADVESNQSCAGISPPTLAKQRPLTKATKPAKKKQRILFKNKS